ncbi:MULTISPECIES: hypothetical protein [Rhizobium]|uniref:hypothetical protein n=1 Tax=Rhizobium TaxID=379 RepID=UPI0011123E37|nr:hypothetical protein [Rhizobium miluonense]
MKIAALDVAGFGTLQENLWYFGTCSEKRPSAFTRYVDKAQPIGGHGWTAISEKVEMSERRRDARVASLDLEGGMRGC